MQLQQFKMHDDFKAMLAPVWTTPFRRFCVDSRQVATGDAFILLKSQELNACKDDEKWMQYLQMVEGKAVFVLSEIDIDIAFCANLNDDSMCIVHLPNIREVLGDWVAQSLQLQASVGLPKVVSVTGTNGKTTISQLVAQLLDLAGHQVAVMGTAGNGILHHADLSLLQASTHTTLQAFDLHHHLYDYAKNGVEFVALEASSHGLHQKRLQGVPVQVAILSNLSRDHLDYHSNMGDYAKTKAMLFDKTLFAHLTHGIINQDDAMAPIFLAQAKQSDLLVWRYSLVDAQADFFAQKIEPTLQGTTLTVWTPKGQIITKSPLLGRFNVANLLAAIAGAMALGLSPQTLEAIIPKLKGAVGRMDAVPSKSGCYIVDYAHTPDALYQVLSSLRVHCQGQLWVVFGCGGDRDKGKRPLMTRIAQELADQVILTADNPRSEEIGAILQDMQMGIHAQAKAQVHIEPDRRQAIEWATRHASACDIVVIAGKGHETYQEIDGVRYDFDDKKVLSEALLQAGKAI